MDGPLNNILFHLILDNTNSIFHFKSHLKLVSPERVPVRVFASVG